MITTPLNPLGRLLAARIIPKPSPPRRLLAARIIPKPSPPRRPAPPLSATPRRTISSPPMGEAAEIFAFGPYKIDRSEVFYTTALSYAMVNLRPLLPGHILFVEREVKRFVDLSVDETSDLWLTAKEVGGRLERHHAASSLTLAIQDGPEAGQTVPHVHIHVIPRKKGDFEKNDEIYDAIDEKEKELKEKLDLDKERKDRSSEEMTQEANEYRALFL